MDNREVVTRVGLAPAAVELLTYWAERRRTRRAERVRTQHPRAIEPAR